MNVIYKTNKVQKEILYPALDITQQLPAFNKVKKDGKLVDIDPKSDEYVTLYFIQEIKPENTKPEQFDLVQQPDVLTDEFHSEYKHLKICIREWKLVEKSQEQVIDSLNQSYGNYLDEQYPQVERLNHSIELQSGTSQERIDYINTLQVWLLACKLDRKKRIENYIENRIFPSFENFIVKP